MLSVQARAAQSRFLPQYWPVEMQRQNIQRGSAEIHRLLEKPDAQKKAPQLREADKKTGDNAKKYSISN